MSEETKSIVRDFFEAMNTRDVERLGELVAGDVTYHGMEVSGLEELRAQMASIAGAFPDFSISIDHLVAEGDKVGAWTVETGTHSGPFEGMPATGLPFSVGEVNLFRIAEGKIAEVWQMSDQLSFMQQLGLMPGPETASEA